MYLINMHSHNHSDYPRRRKPHPFRAFQVIAPQLVRKLIIFIKGLTIHLPSQYGERFEVGCARKHIEQTDGTKAEPEGREPVKIARERVGGA